MAFRGVGLGPWQHIPTCTGPPTSGGIHHGTQWAKRRGMQPKFCQGFPLFSRLWMWYSCHQLLLDIIVWSHCVNCWPSPTIISFSHPHYYTKERQDTRLVLQQPHMYQVVPLIWFMYTHPPLTRTRTMTRKRKSKRMMMRGLLINLVKFVFVRVTEVVSLGVGK